VAARGSRSDQTRAVTSVEPRPNQRERILDIALGLMSAHGSTGMSMRQLASACGVQVAAIYHYFPSKQALLAAVVAERQYGSRLGDPLPIDPAASPSDRLRDLFVAVWQGAVEEESVWRLLLGESLRGEAAVQPVGQALLDLLGPATTEWVKRCVPEAVDAEAVGHMLMGQLFTGFIRMMFDPELDRATIASEGADVLVRGVALPD
jgi:AcrR family transcriptional regulator